MSATSNTQVVSHQMALTMQRAMARWHRMRLINNRAVGNGVRMRSGYVGSLCNITHVYTA